MSERRLRPRDDRVRPLYWEPSLTFLKYAIASLLAGSAAVLLAVFVFVPEQTLRSLCAGSVLLVALTAWFLLARGKVEATVYVLAVGMWAAVTGTALYTGGVQGTPNIIYPQIILLIGWFVGARAAVALALSTVAVLLGFALAESWGFLPLPLPTPPAVRWIIQSAVFLFSVVLIVYFVRSYQSRLNELSDLDHDLNRAQAVAHIGSWVYELASDTMRLSAETCRIFGLPKGTIGSHDTYLARVHPDDRARVDGAWQSALEGGPPFDNQHRILFGDSVRWVRQVAELEKDANGRPLRSVGTTQDVTERKQAEDALLESEGRFRDLLQNIPNVAVQGYAMDGTTRYWNHASEQLYGYSAEEAVGRSLLDLIIPAEMRDGVKEAIAQMAATGQPIPASELSLLRKNGSRVAIYSSHAMVQMPGREPELFCVDIDLTERNQVAAALRESEERFRRLAENAPDLIYRYDLAPARGFSYVSPAATAVTGYTPEEHYADPDLGWKLVHPDDRHMLEAAAKDHSPGSKTIELRWRKKDGSVIWTEQRNLPIFDGAGNLIALEGMARDITERKRNEDQYHTIIQASIDGFWITDFFGRILDANDSICRQLGYTRSELLGMSIRDIDADETPQEVAARTQEMIQTGGARFPARHRCKDGAIIDVEVSVLQVPALGERLFAFVRDITKRRRAEAARAEIEGQLRESQKMEALGTLAGGVAHDFNNIVAAIVGNVELARQDVGPGHPALESLEEIRKASRRARDLVQQILAFGRRQVLERKVISLAPAIDESVRLLRSTLPAGVDLQVECAPDAPEVLADATQIEQVLLNLCSNAWQAMQTQNRPGAIKVRLTKHGVEGAPYLGLERRSKGERIPLRQGRYACLTVADNGPGMDRATRSRIFEPFFTTKPRGEGTGLGLSVVHGIVHDHEASIVVQSVPGEGATFRIYFPAAAQPASEQSPTPETLAADAANTLVLQGEGRHILYIDDDDAIVFLMTRLLLRQGYRVSGHTDAQAALAAVRADPGGFDLVVTDYNMPGTSGLEVARALREIRADLPVALASGYITEELREKAPAAGVRELIYKPDTVEEFCQTVARLVNTLPD